MHSATLALFAAGFAGAAALGGLRPDTLTSAAAPVPAVEPVAWPAKHTFDHKSAVTAVAFGPTFVLAGEESGGLVAWSLQTGKAETILVPQDSHRPHERLQLSADGELLYGVTNGRANVHQSRVYLLMGKERFYTGLGTGGSQAAFGVTTDGAYWLHAETKKKRVLLLSKNPMPDGAPFIGDEPVARFTHKDDVALATAGGVDLIGTVSGGVLRRWSKGSEKPVWEAKLDGFEPTALAACPAREVFAVAGAGGETRVYGGPTGKLLATHKGHAGKVFAVAFSPDGKRAATGGADKTARVWDAATGKVLAVLTGHADAVTGVAFAPDGLAVATGSADKTAKVWAAEK